MPSAMVTVFVLEVLRARKHTARRRGRRRQAEVYACLHETLVREWELVEGGGYLLGFACEVLRVGTVL